MTKHGERIEIGLVAMLYGFLIAFVVGAIYVIVDLLIAPNLKIFAVVIGGIIGLVIAAYVIGYVLSDMKEDIEAIRGDDR